MSEMSVKKIAPLAVGWRLGPYELVRWLGAGGMGVVYEARDHEHSTTVALKTLHQIDAVALLRLKAEFRSMANVLHPNLVQLYELHAIDGVWFFTMEYVEGDSLSTVLKRAKARNSSRQSLLSMDTHTLVYPNNQNVQDAVATVTSDQSPSSAPEPVLSRHLGSLLELNELYHVFRQLAQGIHALHQAHRLHCDIKPSNIMVARNGRVLVLDFGLVSDLALPQRHGIIKGTPAYMSPEQAEGRPATKASDWYALGVMLYEVLSGDRPSRPQSSSHPGLMLPSPPTLPASLPVPEELRALCHALLQYDPAARPSGPQVLELFRGKVEPVYRETDRASPVFIGRQAQLGALHEAWRTVRAGKAVTLHVKGHSGMGKTALVQHFLEELQRREGALVLSGRCHERESVPYKGFDSLIDSLAHYLGLLPAAQRHALSPPDMGELSRLFPVLRKVGVPALAVTRLEEGASHELREVRRRAFLVLKELLARLARQVPLVLHIDDLQWGDMDSFTLLHELLSPAGEPPLLLVCSFRLQDAGAAALQAEHRRMKSLLGERLDLREVEVGSMTEPEARQLALTLLGGHAPEVQVDALVHEAQGNPFFLEELVQHQRGALESSAGEGRGRERPAPTLEQLVLDRTAQLPEQARRTLEVLAVAGRGLPQGLAFQASGARDASSRATWSLLRARGLVRTHGARDSDLVECYHDRIRETLFAQLSSNTRSAHHLQLANLYETAGQADPEVLAVHYQGAGVRDKAGHYLALAADRATQALAFERAAELYRSALEYAPGDRQLLLGCADALANAGRLAESAPLYRQVAQGAPEQEALRLELKAAEQLLCGGHFDEGLAVLQPLLARSALPYPRTAAGALLGMLTQSLRLKLRGFYFQPRPEGTLPAGTLWRIDTALAVSRGLGSIDMARGVYYTLVGTRLTLEAGEPKRIANTLPSIGLSEVGPDTPKGRERGLRLLEQAMRMAEELNQPALIGNARVCGGSAQMLMGQWAQASRELEQGLALLERCTGVSATRSFAQALSSCTMWWRGDLHALATRGTSWLRRAEESGDLYLTLWLKLYMSAVLLASDEPEETGRMMAEVSGKLSNQLFTGQHLLHDLLACNRDLYLGRTEAAWDRIRRLFKSASAAFLLTWKTQRVWVIQVRGAVAVSLASEQPARRRAMLTQAEKDAASLEREGRPYARGAAALLKAASASLRGQPEHALAGLEMAIRAYEEADMPLMVACARHQKSVLLGEGGRELRTQAEAVMREQGIRRPERWSAIYAPGFIATR